MNSFNVIVVGAGPAGCFLSKLLAEAGFKVALLERRAPNEIGHSWEVAVENHIFSRVILSLPPESLLSESPDVYRFYAGEISEYVEMDASLDSVVYLTHRKMNKYLLDKAIARGVYFLPQHRVLDPVVSNDFVRGVVGYRKSLFGKKNFSYRAPIVVDASGNSRILVRKMPKSSRISEKILPGDFVTAWQEFRRLSPDQEERLARELSIKPGVYYSSIGKYRAYQVIHLCRNHQVNLIFGASMGYKTPSIRKIMTDFHEAYPFFGTPIRGGGRPIPLRHSISNLVMNGFLCLGDAACMVVPTTGSGVSSALYAADLSARAITEALNVGDYSSRTLWEYNRSYFTKRGAILASYDVIRRFLQSLSESKLKSIFRAGLLSDQQFIKLYASHRIVYDTQQILSTLSKIIGNLNLLPLGIQLANVVRQSEKVLFHFQKYPEKYDPTMLERWHLIKENLFKMV
ncbi:MAG: NAD(P)/FAD-dependent oxidoreductase [Spirochaetales bacterium]|nr:NAD(P)/FAD-dependent oxidoreductase [Spirochaetales bacterium]